MPNDAQDKECLDLIIILGSAVARFSVRDKITLKDTADLKRTVKKVFGYLTGRPLTEIEWSDFLNEIYRA